MVCLSLWPVEWGLGGKRLTSFFELEIFRFELALLLRQLLVFVRGKLVEGISVCFELKQMLLVLHLYLIELELHRTQGLLQAQVLLAHLLQLCFEAQDHLSTFLAQPLLYRPECLFGKILAGGSLLPQLLFCLGAVLGKEGNDSMAVLAVGTGSLRVLDMAGYLGSYEFEKAIQLILKIKMPFRIVPFQIHIICPELLQLLIYPYQLLL